MDSKFVSELQNASQDYYAYAGKKKYFSKDTLHKKYLKLEELINKCNHSLDDQSTIAPQKARNALGHPEERNQCSICKIWMEN